MAEDRDYLLPGRMWDCSLVNEAAILRQSMPTAEQLKIWDSWIIPASRVVDPILMHSVGKSIVGVWRKPLQRWLEPVAE